MKEISLVFSSSGDAVWIEFENGKTTTICDTKEEAVQMIFNLQMDGLISKEVRNDFIVGVIRSSLASEGLDEEQITAIAIVEFEIDASNGPIEKLKNATFNVSERGTFPLHGYIYSQEGEKVLGPIFSKVEGISIITDLLQKDIIEEDAFDYLKVQIDLSPLLDNHHAN